MCFFYFSTSIVGCEFLLRKEAVGKWEEVELRFGLTKSTLPKAAGRWIKMVGGTSKDKTMMCHNATRSTV